MIKQQDRSRIRRVKPEFRLFQKVWRVFGNYKVPAVVYGHPIVRYGEENEFVEILLIINGFCALRAVPSNFLIAVVDAEKEGWTYDWPNQIKRFEQQEVELPPDSLGCQHPMTYDADAQNSLCTRAKSCDRIDS